MSEKLHDPGEPKPFPCRSCGACCMDVKHVPDLQRLGWVSEDGSCSQYDHALKRCDIYVDRPFICRIDGCRPPMLSVEAWTSLNLSACHHLHRKHWGRELEEEGKPCRCVKPKARSDEEKRDV